MALFRHLRSLSFSRSLAAGTPTPSLYPLTAAVGAWDLLLGPAQALAGQVRQMSGAKTKRELFIEWAIDDESLRDAFAPFGEIMDARVISRRRAGTPSRGYGFVKFSTEEEAQRAIEGMRGRSMGGRLSRVEFCKEPKFGPKLGQLSGEVQGDGGSSVGSQGILAQSSGGGSSTGSQEIPAQSLGGGSSTGFQGIPSQSS